MVFSTKRKEKKMLIVSKACHVGSWRSSNQSIPQMTHLNFRKSAYMEIGVCMSVQSQYKGRYMQRTNGKEVTDRSGILCVMENLSVSSGVSPGLSGSRNPRDTLMRVQMTMQSKIYAKGERKKDTVRCVFFLCVCWKI